VAQVLDFFFFPGSTYTYLTANRIERVAHDAGVQVRWRPFSVRAIMREAGNVPFPEGSAIARYMWRDIERRAARYGIPFASAPSYPVDPDQQALRVALVAADEGWCPEFLKESYRAWFLENKAPGVGSNTLDVIAAVGRKPDTVMARADAPDIHEAVLRETQIARELGIFGSPTFVVGQEIFWGDDRLEDAIDFSAYETEAEGSKGYLKSRLHCSRASHQAQGADRERRPVRTP
jgi:2-hydroxychromene-2-carboxylate isomerase